MINGKLEQFLDTGWYSEAAMFYKGNVYWCEAQKMHNSDEILFFVDRWAATNEDNICYHSLINKDGEMQWKRVFEASSTDLSRIKRQFLEAPIFEGKTFWQIEREVAWLEEGEAIVSSE